MYTVTRSPSQPGRPPLNTFGSLFVREIPQGSDLLAAHPGSGSTLFSMPGVFSPRELGVKLSQIGKEGVRVSDSEFKKHQPLYSYLFQGELHLIEDGYLYRAVRICHVDPQAPPTHCINPDIKPQ
jgi:hypothetical protein